MLDEKDVSVLEVMFARQEKKYGKDLRDLHERLNQLEQKMMGEFYVTREAVIDIINTGIHPQLDRLNARILRLERLQPQT